MSFWKELSRRNVVKVGIAYAVAAWLIIHPVDIIFPILHLPEWSITLVAAFLIILFPLVLIFSWVYEVTPKGLKKTKEVPVSKSITHLTGKRLNYIIVGLLVVALGYFVFDKYFISHGAVETKQTSVVTETPKTQKTIAVLPFEDLSPAKDQEYFVLGLSEEILNSLAQIQNLKVIARTSSFAFKGKDKTVQEIAGVLGVDNILEGSVRKAGNDLRITAQLVSAVDGSHLWSETYDRKLKDIFAVQKDIATAVADELKVTLGIGGSLKQLGGTDNLKAYEQYLVAKGLWVNQTQSDSSDLTILNRALDSVDAAIAIDPKFALAWVYKAYTHGILKVQGPANRAATEQDAALSSAQKAIEIEPNLADGYAALGWAKMSKRDWIEAGLAFRKALELQTESLSGSEQIVIHYHAIGYLKKAHEHLEKTRQIDPLNQSIRAFYLLNFILLDDTQRAEEEYEREKALFGKQRSLLRDSYISYERLSHDHVVSRDEIVYSTPIFDKAKEQLASPKEGLIDLRRIYTNSENLSSFYLFDMSVWAAYFGDPEFAMDAIEKATNLEAGGIFHIWLPIMKEVRQTPRFKTFVKKIGLVDYWNKFGWPDMCHKLDNGDFVCD